MRQVVMVVCVVLGLGLAACSHESTRPKDEAEASVYPPPPAGSPMAKIHEGMTEPQVGAILGAPDDSKAYITGKAFIPWYFGPDQSRFACYYKGKGRVIFSGGNQWGAGRGKVIRVEYDPSEAGIANRR